MADLANELVAAVRRAFTRNCKSDTVIAGIEDTLKKNGVSYREAEEYAARLGEMLAKAYQETITPDLLPDGRIDEELAEALIRQLLSQNYEEAARVAAQVQTSLNRSAGLGMKGLQPKVNKGRIDDLIKKTASYDSYEKQAWMLDEPIVNCTQSAVEETIRKNADAHFKSGLHPKIKRTSVGGCCEWCNNLAGTYDYPVPKEIYRRHERCRCLVLYDPGDGKIQNAHTKKVYEGSLEQVEKREREKRIEQEAKSEAEITVDVERADKIFKGATDADLEAAVNTAKNGGQNYGAYVDLSNQTKKQLRKSINSLIEQVNEHEKKIANPAGSVDNWESKNENYKAGIIRKWEKDKKRNATLGKIALEIWKERFK